MGEENVEIVRRSLEALSRGDFDAALAAHDLGSEWRTAADEPDSRTYRGIEEIRRMFVDLAEPWTDRFDATVEHEEFLVRGSWVVVPWRARLHGRSSGVEMDLRETYAVLLRAGRIVRVEEYRTTEEALRAVRTHGSECQTRAGWSW